MSAVDTQTERHRVENLRPALAGRTVLIATQRLSTVEVADRASAAAVEQPCFRRGVLTLWAGAAAILNFARVPVDVPPQVTVKDVNMALELETLSYALRQEGAEAGRAGQERKAGN